MDLFEHDRRFLAVVDEAMELARERAGERWGCGPGRADCCIGPFPINLLDARRLQRGLAQLAETEPAKAEAIRERARAAVGLLREGIPGNPASGILDENDDDDTEQQRYLTAHEKLACPALDPATRTCELYAHRPWTCRTFGPPIRVGREDLPPCPYCFEPCTPQELESMRVEPDPEGLEETLLDALEREEGVAGETLIAFALCGLPSNR
jgi:Fe-S-cluster containining protein